MKGLWLLLLILILFFLPTLGHYQVGPPAPPVQSNISVSAEVPGVSPPPGGGGGGGAPAPTTKVIFEGKAYPLAFLTLLKNEKVAATFSADSESSFRKELSGVSSGNYTFGIFAEDTEGRTSVTLSFTISVLEGMTTTVKRIFISPTIELSNEIIRKGAAVNILGQAYPQSKIQIFVSSPGPTPLIKETSSSQEGKWKYSLDTSPLSLGDHITKARATTFEGEQSPFSQETIFRIVEMSRGADLNFDGKVNIVDFSILLYFWKQTEPANICADMNFDGVVNIFDFSIMMYWWSG